MQQVSWLFHGHKPEERADRREPGVTAPGGVAAFILDMGEEVADKRDVHLLDCQLCWSLARLFVRKLEQQPEGVPVGGNRVRTRRQLSAKPVGEELLDQRGGVLLSWLHLLNTL